MSSILSSVENGIGIIRLNRPDKFNSFNREMALALQSVLDAFAGDKSVRAVLITAEGKAFCAGQDLAEAIDTSGPGIQTIVREHYNPVIKKIRAIEKPVVCAVNGVAAGAGANIALACDIVIAGASASFIQAFSKIGLVPDSGGTFFLPRIIGFQRAAALMMLGDKVSASDALQMGMIYKVCDDAHLTAESMAIATTLSNMPTKGIALTKQLLNDSMTNTLDAQLDREEIIQAAAGNTYDYQEGVNAFLEKRKPIFKGE
ncbi:MAG TPA: 2-(1,2-epoxy-1,2-dihydrophenyl)acetyl-CoA isomerase PaaG [Bacteroidia bacterium]|nr:2-(1,2-epoxy-1,2-dihydrophenyl)acetyl-CoA isomerase PaaG [Bacteroidia bacterium]